MTDAALSSLIRINRQRMRLLRQALAPYGYVGTMHLILLYTDRNPGASQEEIVSFYALDKSSVARDAKRLEGLGHVTRETAPENRRQYRLHLTNEGREMVALIRAQYDLFAAQLSAGISDSDWELLTRLLKSVERNLS